MLSQIILDEGDLYFARWCLELITKWSKSLWLKSCEKLFCSNFLILIQMIQSGPNFAHVTCAKLWPDQVAPFHVKATCIFTRFEWRAHKLRVKWVPLLLFICKHDCVPVITHYYILHRGSMISHYFTYSTVVGKTQHEVSAPWDQNVIIWTKLSYCQYDNFVQMMIFLSSNWPHRRLY